MSSESYIGASDAQQIYPENTVDYIAVQTGVVQYRLSQDVPGGYEGNVLVVRNGTVLKPESDYSIDYSNIDHINNLITFQISISPSDQIYVVHKGVATYNLTPSPRSVTDDSLCENLRTFIFEHFDGTGGQQEFTLIKQEFYPRSLLVYVNGQVQRPYVDASDEPNKWDFKLEQIDETTSKITFRTAPGAGTANVCVLHLAFSTVLRRSDYLTSILLSPGIIETQHLQDNAVNGNKILLNNGQWIRAKKVDTTPVGIIQLDASDRVDLYSTLILNSTGFQPIHGNTVNLGSSSERFLNFFTINISCSNLIETVDLLVTHDADIVNNLTVDGQSDLRGKTVLGTLGTPVDVEVHGITVDIDATNIHLTGSDVTINGTHLEGIPIGSVMMYYGTILPDAPNSKYLFCDGSAIPGDSKYNDFKTWLTLQGLPNINTPNLKQKFIFGRDDALSAGFGKNVGDLVGSATHIHNVNNHNHSLSSSNAVITDGGHTHTVSGTAVIPSHTHYLNDHYHPIKSHSHSYAYMHYHSIGILSGAAETAHMHIVRHKSDSIGVTLGSSYHQFMVYDYAGVFSAEEWPSVPPSERHKHNISGNTKYSASGLQNWGYDNGTKYTGSTATESAGIVSGYWNGTQNVAGLPYNRTRYNKNDETDPGNMSVQTGTTVSLSSGTASSGTANSTISGTTENKTALITQNNDAAFCVPGFTFNFIIRAIA